MPLLTADRPEVKRTASSNNRSLTTSVLVWRSGSRADLDTQLQEWRDDGWQVKRCIPRVVEGPAFGALIVLQKMPTPIQPAEHGERNPHKESPVRSSDERRPLAPLSGKA